MKRSLLYSLFILLVFCIACNEEKEALVPVGTLRLNIDKNEQVLTKTPVVNELLRVDILSATGDTVKSYNNYIEEVQNEKLVLPVGTYTVAVVSNQSEAAGWETPLYAGKETVKVKAGEITSATVVCQIANTKVTVSCTDGVKENFVNYETTVSNSSGSLLYTRDEYRAGYFTPEKLTASLVLTNNDGKEYTINRVFTDIKPRYHYTIMFKIGDKPDKPEGGRDFNITVDDKAKVVECEIVIDEDDMEGKKVPVIKLSDAFNESQLSIKIGEDVPSSSLLITSQVGIETFTVKAESDLFKAEDGLNQFDLTKLNDITKIHLSSLGFPLFTEDLNVNNITLDFDKLVGAFLQDISTEKAKKVHTFTVYAMDSLHQETEQTFSFEIRPDVAVVTNKANAFSTFAFLSGETQETSGHAFKFRKQGDSDFKTIEAQINDDGTFSALVNSLTPGTDYEYIAIAGEDSEGDLVAFTTEGALELPGGKFDEWNGNDPANSFWSSGNNMFVNDLLKATKFVSTSDNKPTENNLYAASMQSKKVPIVNLGAGNLFTGDFERIGTKGGKITLGRSFSARPTRLIGYYCYTPGSIDLSGTIKTPSGKSINIPSEVTDTCSIYIVLSKEKYVVNTTMPETLFDMNMPEFQNRIVAFAELPANKSISTNQKYEKFELTLKYLQPDYSGEIYIAIVCSASKYGDYFKGSTYSIFNVDEFELSYDYDPTCFSNE